MWERELRLRADEILGMSGAVVPLGVGTTALTLIPLVVVGTNSIRVLLCSHVPPPLAK